VQYRRFTLLAKLIFEGGNGRGEKVFTALRNHKAFDINVTTRDIRRLLYPEGAGDVCLAWVFANLTNDGIDAGALTPTCRKLVMRKVGLVRPL
jgi:hypothetical protein